MDHEKIGRFIAACRKEQGLTQADLAEKLGITDRAVSKWETGRSLPDASIMLELCDLLEININELFTGERIGMDQYQKMAEQHLLEMRKQEERRQKGEEPSLFAGMGEDPLDRRRCKRLYSRNDKCNKD